MAPNPQTSPMSDADLSRHAKRAVLASTVGTMIEWYDFYLYGLVAAIVFGKLYFPSQDPYSATLLAFSTFFLGFVARPVGAIIFGHFGDRIGRKGTLVATLMLKGIGVGGEWGGAIAVATEWSKFNRSRGLAASWPQFGSPLGMLLAVGMLTLTLQMGSTEWFETIGWRIPFLVSALLIFVGLYIRLGVLETPVFQRMQEKKEIAQAPVIEAVRGFWKEILLTCLMRTGQQATFLLFTTFLFWYLTSRLGLKRMYLIGAFTMMVFAFPYFWLLDTGVPALIVLAILVSLPIHDMQYAPQAAFIAESFPPSVRYSGSSIGYQLASITSGGPAPIIAAFLLHTYGTSAAISAYIAFIAAISFVSTLFLRDRSRDDYTSNAGWVRDDGSVAVHPGASPMTPRAASSPSE